MVFHEITQPAIEAALNNPRAIDEELVEARETRRILDRLYGYEVSPVLWKKVKPRLSAGRVQSAAVRLIVDREWQRMRFVRASFWDVDARLATRPASEETVASRLVELDGKRVASGRDFDPAIRRGLVLVALRFVVLLRVVLREPAPPTPSRRCLRRPTSGRSGPLRARAAAVAASWARRRIVRERRGQSFDNGAAGVASSMRRRATPAAVSAADVDVTAAQDAGGGYLVGWVNGGEWLNYAVNVATAGTYDMEFRVASGGTGGTFHIEVGGVNKSGSIAIPNTGGWQTWTTVRKTGIALSAGTQTIRLVMDGVGPSGAVGNFNWFRVVTPGSAPPGSTPFSGTPMALPGTVEAENFDNGGAGVASSIRRPVTPAGNFARPMSTWRRLQTPAGVM